MQPPITPPPGRPADSQIPTVEFRHPAALPTACPLLRLACPDDGGIDYDVAIVACGILADNRWVDAWFTTLDGDQHTRVGRPDDNILREPFVFYFHVKGADDSDRYPVVPSFDHWRFPHGSSNAATLLPPPWDTLRAGARALDHRCCITGSAIMPERAHVVPVAARNWFTSNGMDRYAANRIMLNIINDSRNTLLCRPDMHTLWDTKRIALLPKRRQDGSGLIVVHAFDPAPTDMAHELLSTYYNRACQLLGNVSAEFLFARFAWTIFANEYIRFFEDPSGTQAFRVRTFDTATGKQSDRTVRSTAGIRGISAVFLAPSSRTPSRSISPKKQKRGPDEMAVLGSRDDVDVSGRSESESESESEKESGGPRGRKRLREWVLPVADTGNGKRLLLSTE